MAQVKFKDRKPMNKSVCDILKTCLLAIFLFIKYYFDLLVDKVFGFFYDNMKVPLSSPKNPIVNQSATTLAKKIRMKELKSEEIVQAFIDRMNEVNPIVNALVDNRFEEALDEARKVDKEMASGTMKEADFQSKPFLGMDLKFNVDIGQWPLPSQRVGVPFTTKETTAVKGLSFTFGLIKRKGYKAEFDADYVTIMKNAGAICLGVTNTPQMLLWPETNNPIYGITKNPYDTTRNAGGSSGGETSLLAAGGTAISIGTDIGGSCRIPAFMCGVFGHKPTSHLIPTKGMAFRTGKEEQTMMVAGVLARFAEEIAPILKLLVAENADKLQLDKPVDIKSVKVYYIADPKDPFVSPSREEMKSTFTGAVKYFSGLCDTLPKEVEFEGTRYSRKLWKYWMTQETNENFNRDIMNREGEAQPLIEILKYFTGRSDFCGSTIMNLFNNMLPTPKDDWARKTTERLSKQILHTLGEDGVLLYPSAPWPASYHHTSFLRPWNFDLFSIWNVLKFPVTQVPMGLRYGLPVGIQVVAAPNQDRLCIAVAKELEKAFGGFVPPYPLE